MTMTHKSVRPHKLSPNAALCISSTYNPIGSESPAIEAMTDFSRVSAVTVLPSTLMSEANAAMISRGVRLLLVTREDGTLAGLVTARDTFGEKPMQVVQARSLKHAELQVADVMTPLEAIDTLHFREVVYATVADILEALKHLGRQHILVEDVDPLTGQPRIRGIFSATQIGRLLGVPVQGFDTARTFAEIETALAA